MSHFAAHIFRQQARERGRATALAFEGEAVTFGTLERRCNQVAHALLREGAQPGDRVALLSRNSAKFFEVLGGTAKSRTCLAPINIRLSITEIAFILGDMAPKLLLVSKEFLPIAVQAARKLLEPPPIIMLDGAAAFPGSFESWRDAMPDHDPGLPLSADDDVVLLYTSGTTGQPKGVRISNRNYGALLAAAPSVQGFSYSAGDTVASTMPLFHVAGINAGMTALSQGCRVVPVTHFMPEDFLALLDDMKVDHAFLAPSMINSLLNAKPKPGGEAFRLKMIAYGAAPISAQVLHAAKERFGCEFAQLYGLTESTGAGTVLTSAAHLESGKQSSAGIPWPGLSLRILDVEGHDVPTGTVGEIVMTGDFITPGYRNRDEATAAAIRNGWLYTGDAGYLDAEGFLFIRDRIKDLIISGGENVFPAEVENAILGCPGVADVAVIGIPSEEWGEEVKAIVVASEGTDPSAASIIAWAKARIASFKAPKSVDFVVALPRNAAGKVLKRELRRTYWAGRDRQIN
jgi:acyl-CoA synthetase (AMP-forming)/AMP-acid ligase II